MTKSELRKARKIAIASGNKLTGELAIKKNLQASKRTINRKMGRIRAKQRKSNQ